MANALPLLLAAGAAMLILGSKKGGTGAQSSAGAPAPAEPGGPTSQVVGSGQLKNPDTGVAADYRIVRDAEIIWSEIRLPGEAWAQQRESRTGKLILFPTVEAAMKSAPLGLAFKGYTEEVS